MFNDYHHFKGFIIFVLLYEHLSFGALAGGNAKQGEQAIAEYLKSEPAIIGHYTRAVGACTYNKYTRLISRKDFSPEDFKRRVALGVEGFDIVPEDLEKSNEVTFVIDGTRLQSDVRQTISKRVDRSGAFPKWKDVSAGPDAAPRFVFCKDSGNSFRILWARRSNTPVLESFGDESALTRWVKEYPGDALHAPFGLFGKRFSEVVKYPEFVVRDASEVDIDGHRCIRVAYDFKLVVKKERRLPPGIPSERAGIVTFSPEEGWVIRGLEFSDRGKPPLQRVTVEYTATEGPYPPLSRVTIQGPETRSEYIFSRFQHGPAPARVFDITNYGLPPLGKPDGGRSLTANPTPWLVGASMTFLAAAIGLGAYARRAKN